MPTSQGQPNSPLGSKKNKPKSLGQSSKPQADPNKLRNRVKLIIMALTITAGLGAYRDQFKSLMETNSLFPAGCLLTALGVYIIYWLLLRGKRR